MSASFKLAVISPFADRRDSYPHVAAIAGALREAFDVEWVTISERGNWPDEVISNSLFSGDIPATFGLASRLERDWRAVRAAARRADAVLALDAMALLLARRAPTKRLIFWSLDYIADDEPRAARKVIRLWQSLVRDGAQHAGEIVIQSAERLAAFEGSAGVQSGRLTAHFLPVSMPPPGPHPGWPGGKPHVLQIGGLNAERSRTDFLLARHEARPRAFDLSLHGVVAPSIAADLEAAGERVRVSTALLPHDEVPQVVGPCSVGFIGNTREDRNFRLLRSASGQLVEFLRCGKPVISMGPQDLGPHLEAHGAGCHVATPADFDAALETIHADYGGYSARAKALFEAEYDLRAYLPGFLAFVRGEAAATACRARA